MLYGDEMGITFLHVVNKDISLMKFTLQYIIVI